MIHFVIVHFAVKINVHIYLSVAVRINERHVMSSVILTSVHKYRLQLIFGVDRYYLLFFFVAYLPKLAADSNKKNM